MINPPMTPRYAATLWGVSEATVKRWAAEERIPAFKPLGGNYWLIPADAEKPPEQKRGLGSDKFIESGKPNPNPYIEKDD